MDHKTCIKCKVSFPATTEFFHKAPANKFGLSSYCKPCKQSVNKKWSDSHAVQHKAARDRWNRWNRTPEYKAWMNIRQRCLNPKCREYRHYGARGIRVSEAWSSFLQFLDDMGTRPGPEYSIERIDNSGHYEASNCKWATKTEQMRNTRSNRMIEFDGKNLCLAEWSEKTGIPSTTIQNRLDVLGWSVKHALTIIPRAKPAQV